MKFKAQAKQNQLLELISPQHLVVGIDIAQQSHVARAVNFRGILLGTPLHFSNDDAGFNQLPQWMKDLYKTHQLNDTIIGMEPTSHYWLSLAAWLKNRTMHLIDAGALATLGLFPMPADLQKLTVRQVFDDWKTVMKRHRGERRAGELLALAARSVGAKHAEKAYKLHLQQLLAEYDLAVEQLQVNALLRHAGLNLAEASSGKWKGQMSFVHRSFVSVGNSWETCLHFF